MKTRKNLVKMMLMSIATAATMMFNACTDDLGEMNDNQQPQGADTALLEAYGLTYQTFDNNDDVMILDADTTMISISCAYADKLGITSFVNHPMGIWQAMNQLPYIRKATAERIEGDRYIVSVVPATVAEIIGDKHVQLNTEIYVNPNPSPALKTRAGGFEMPDYAAKYVDENSVIHPAVILMTDPYGYDKPYHTPDEQPVALQTRAAQDGEYACMTADEILSRSTRASIHNRIFSFDKKLEQDFKWPIGKGSKDSLYLNFEANLKFGINYFITIDGGVKWNAIIPTPYVNKFEAGLDGEFGFDTEIQFGFNKEWELDPDKWRQTLFTFTGYTFTFMVGPVPVAIEASPELFAKLDGKVNGKIFMGMKYEYANNFKAGITYDGETDKWGVIKEFNEEKNTFTYLPPQAEVHAEAGFGIYLGAKIKIYKVAGPELSVGPRLGAEATLSISPYEEKLDLEAEVKMTMNAVVGAKIEVLGYELAGTETTIELAGPWTLWKFPSDGSEHKVEPWISPIIKQRIEESMHHSYYGASITRLIQENIDLLKAMNNIDDEAARKMVYLDLKENSQVSDLELTDAMVSEIITRLGEYNTILKQQYADWEYQQHKDDAEWIGKHNWQAICDELKAGKKIDEYTYERLLSGEMEIHQWFLDEFHREPTLASAEDISWIIDHLNHYYSYRDAKNGKGNTNTDEQQKDTKVEPNLDEIWATYCAQLKEEFPNLFIGRRPLGPTYLNQIRKNFKTKFGHEAGMDAGDYELVRKELMRRGGL